MTKNHEHTRSGRLPYEAPLTESHSCEYQRLLSTSLSGHAGDGDEQEPIDSKKINFSFEDPWDDLKI